MIEMRHAGIQHGSLTRWQLAKFGGSPLTRQLRHLADRVPAMTKEWRFEERDFVERTRRAGWLLGLACNSCVYHEHGRTLSLRSPQSHYYLLRHKLLYERKLNGSLPVTTLSKNLCLVRTR
jgi:hypothetical protein